METSGKHARIEGACHCGNIHYVLTWPEVVAEVAVRECGCTFCRKHAGAWTSHRDAEIACETDDSAGVSIYQFGTRTADFYVCSCCGAVPLVVSEVDDHLYAVVNVNTFTNFDRSLFSRSATDFEGEDTGSRLGRRKRNWIPNVQIIRSVN